MRASLLVVVRLLLGVGACSKPAGAPNAPVHVIVAPMGGDGGTASTPLAERRRICRATFAPRGYTSNVVVIEDGAGNPVKLKTTQGDDVIEIVRKYDDAHRLVRENRSWSTVKGARLSTIAWERDGRGRVVGAERTDEQTGADAAALRRLLVTFPERHSSGRWLRRESRLEDGRTVRTDTRQFDQAGRVVQQRGEETGAGGTTAGRVTTTRFTYAGASRKPTSERVEVATPGGAPQVKYETEYDDRGRPTRTHEWTGEDAGLWTLTYDVKGRPASRTRADGAHESYSYEGDCPTDFKALFNEPSTNDEAMEGP